MGGEFLVLYDNRLRQIRMNQEKIYNFIPKPRIKKLAAAHPEECNIAAENQDGSVYAYISALWIKILPPRPFTGGSGGGWRKDETELVRNDSSTVMKSSKFE